MRLRTTPDDSTLARPATEQELRRRVRALVGVRWGALALPLALYGLALALLLVRIDAHPPFVYNWEEYTAWRVFPFWDHPTWDIFTRDEGLMTDSGHNVLLAAPIWVGFALGGVSLATMRLALAVITAAAVPLLWAVARRLADSRTALLAATLLALSPVFLLYGRTATSVGLSLVPMLATVVVLVQLLQNPRQWGWIAALQGLLVVGQYAYAPIRFLWPISLGLFIVEGLWRRQPGARGVRQRLARAFVVTAVTLPGVLLVTSPPPRPEPLDTMLYYFRGRDEQIAGLSVDSAYLKSYLRLTPQEQATGQVVGTPDELVRRLLWQNITDFANLLLDRDTAPALLNHWLPTGRLYPGLLLPFFVLGLAGTAWRARRRLEDRALLALFCGFGLPIILTTRVHIGRLIFMLPFLLLLVAAGFWAILDFGFWILDRWARRRKDPQSQIPNPKSKIQNLKLARAGLALALVAAVAGTTWEDYRVPPALDHETRILRYLQATLPALTAHGAAAALVQGGDPEHEAETIHAAAYRLALDPAYRFVDLGAAPGAPGYPLGAAADGRAPVYYGALLDRLVQPGTVPTACANVYLVNPAFLARFQAVNTQLASTCGHPLHYQLLPP